VLSTEARPFGQGLAAHVYSSDDGDPEVKLLGRCKTEKTERTIEAGSSFFMASHICTSLSQIASCPTVELTAGANQTPSPTDKLRKPRPRRSRQRLWAAHQWGDVLRVIKCAHRQGFGKLVHCHQSDERLGRDKLFSNISACRSSIRFH